jgi:hypothetical protein
MNFSLECQVRAQAATRLSAVAGAVVMMLEAVVVGLTKAEKTQAKPHDLLNLGLLE